MEISDLFPLIDRLRLQMPLESITMDILAAKSGLSRATLYRNYGGRQAILSAYLQKKDISGNQEFNTSMPQRILEAARDTFLDKGFANATIDMIAEQAGVGTATIYRYFGSKENLIAEVLEMFLSLTEPDLEILENDQALEDLLQEFTRSAIRYLQENRRLIRLLLVETRETEQLTDKMQRLKKRAREKLIRSFSRRISDPKLRLKADHQLTAAYFGMLIGFAFSDNLLGVEGFREEDAAAWITRSIMQQLEVISTPLDNDAYRSGNS